MKRAVFFLLLNIVIGLTCLTDFNLPSWANGLAIGMCVTALIAEVVMQMKDA